MKERDPLKLMMLNVAVKNSTDSFKDAKNEMP